MRRRLQQAALEATVIAFLPIILLVLLGALSGALYLRLLCGLLDLLFSTEDHE